MKQNPAYRRDQSRALHRLYRRLRLFTNRSVILWSSTFAILALAAMIDQLFGLIWEFSPEDIWTFLGFSMFGGVFWVFATLIMKFNLRYVRYTYGPDPGDTNKVLR